MSRFARFHETGTKLSPGYTDGDNSTSTSTDTIKNIVNVVARENTGLSTEQFCQVLAKRYLERIRKSVRLASSPTKPNGIGLTSTVGRTRAAFCSTATASRLLKSAAPVTD
jgi:hypothetical protein